MAKTSVYLNKALAAAIAADGRTPLQLIAAGLTAGQIRMTTLADRPEAHGKSAAADLRADPAEGHQAAEPAASDCKHKRALGGWCRECRTGGHFPAAEAQGNMKGTT
jgi:hypothetical protein